MGNRQTDPSANFSDGRGRIFLKRPFESGLNCCDPLRPLSCDFGGQRPAQLWELSTEISLVRITKGRRDSMQGRNSVFGAKVILQDLLCLSQLADRLCSPSGPPVTALRPAVIRDDMGADCRVRMTQRSGRGVSQCACNFVQAAGCSSSTPSRAFLIRSRLRLGRTFRSLSILIFACPLASRSSGSSPWRFPARSRLPLI